MKRKRILLAALALAALQWGCMDYKEFSDIAVDQFSPEVVIPVAADTAYVTDAHSNLADATSVRFKEDGSVYMYYETSDTVSASYDLDIPKINNTLSVGPDKTKWIDIKDQFGINYEIAGLTFKSGKVESNVNVTVGGLELTGGVEVELANKSLKFEYDTDKSTHVLQSNVDCQLTFSEPEIATVWVAKKQGGNSLFVQDKELGAITLDMFEENHYADHDFNSANFKISVEKRGVNVTKAPFRFILKGVQATYNSIDPATFDGSQQPQPKPSKTLISNAEVKSNELVVRDKIDGQPAGKWSTVPQTISGNRITFEANESNSNLRELLKDGPKTVMFGNIFSEFDADQLEGDYVELLPGEHADTIILTYEFELPLSGTRMESFWLQEIRLQDSLPNLNSNEISGSFNKYLDMQDDDYVELKLQFVNRFPFDIFANLRFISFKDDLDEEILKSLRLEFSDVQSIGGNNDITNNFQNENFKQFLAAKAAPKNDKGVATGETRNVVSCRILYSQYKVIQKHADGIEVNYRAFSPTGQAFTVQKDDYIYLRVGVKAKPTVSYNSKR